MKKDIIFFIIFILFPSLLKAQSILNVRNVENKFNVSIPSGDSCLLISPEEGLWSVATSWKNDWPAKWYHSSPDKFQEVGDWKIFSGTLSLPEGKCLLQDAYKNDNGMI